MKYLFLIATLIFVSCQAVAKVDLPFKIQHAVDLIESNFGDKVVISPKTVLKFGRSLQVNTSTYATLMTLPSGVYNETYATTNAIDKFSSSNAGDTQSIVVEGHKLVGTDFVFVRQTVTLVGQTETALTTALARVSRVYNNNSTDFAGIIYIYEDDTVTAGVPQTDAKVHLMISAGQTNQSEKTATTISSTEYLIITSAFGSVNTKASTPLADLQIQIRLYGKVFRTVAIAAIATAGSNSVTVSFDPVVVIPKNADIRIRALGSANNIDVSGWFSGYFAKIKQ